MAKPVPLGIRGIIEEKIQHQHTLNYHNPALPSIFSTPNMIGLMEQAAFLALAPYGDPGEISVGTAINIEHRAATGIGATVTAEAVLESQAGRFYVFRVTAHNGEREIGRGTVTRTFVNLPKMAPSPAIGS
jgi:predicted thioesterase